MFFSSFPFIIRFIVICSDLRLFTLIMNDFPVTEEMSGRVIFFWLEVRKIFSFRMQCLSLSFERFSFYKVVSNKCVCVTKILLYLIYLFLLLLLLLMMFGKKSFAQQMHENPLMWSVGEGLLLPLLDWLTEHRWQPWSLRSSRYIFDASNIPFFGNNDGDGLLQP